MKTRVFVFCNIVCLPPCQEFLLLYSHAYTRPHTTSPSIIIK